MWIAAENSASSGPSGDASSHNYLKVIMHKFAKIGSDIAEIKNSQSMLSAQTTQTTANIDKHSKN